MAMNRRQWFIVIGGLMAVWLLAAGASAAPVAEFDLGWHVIASGGGHASSADYALDGTLGQPAVGGMSSASYHLGAGYWGDTAPPGCRIFLPAVLKVYL